MALTDDAKKVSGLTPKIANDINQFLSRFTGHPNALKALNWDASELMKEYHRFLKAAAKKPTAKSSAVVTILATAVSAKLAASGNLPAVNSELIDSDDFTPGPLSTTAPASGRPGSRSAK